jgi:hypothetical protein
MALPFSVGRRQPAVPDAQSVDDLIGEAVRQLVPPIDLALSQFHFRIRFRT